MFDVILDTLIDGVKLLPFLFLTYLVMEFLEHRADSKSRNAVAKAGRFGPVIGGALGVVPQCGFSAAASNLFAGRVITPGTLIAIFLSTSDEMLPVFVSEQVEVGFIVKVLIIKVVLGIMLGLMVDFVYYNLMKKKSIRLNICHICEKEHCHCSHEHSHDDDDRVIKAPGKKEEDHESEGILLPALMHSLKIFAFILVISFILNVILYYVGEEQLKNFAVSIPVVSQMITGLIGLIPNCAASVVITELYIEGIITFGAMMSGLLAGAGIGVLILFRINDRLKENLAIISVLYLLGVCSGVILDLFM